MATSNAEKRIRNLFSSLYLSEPVYQAVALSHKLVEDKNISTVSVGKRKLRFNPEFIEKLSDEDFENVMFSELDRILLKHPYDRKRKNASAAWNASSMAIRESTNHCKYFMTASELRKNLIKRGYTEDQEKFFKLYKKLEAMPDEELKRKTGWTKEKLYAQRERMEIPDERTISKRHMEYYYNLFDKFAEVNEVLVFPKPNEEENKEDEGEDEEKKGGKGKKGDKPEKEGKNGESENKDSSEGEGEAKEGSSGEPSEGSSDSPTEGSGSPKGKNPMNNSEDAREAYVRPEDPDELAKDWGEDELMETELNDIISNAQATGQWGSISGNFKEEIIAGIIPKVDYKALLRSLKMRVLSSKTTLNRMRPNRRFGFGFPGNKREYTTKVDVYIDTSASVDSASLSKALGVINGIFKCGCERIDVWFFDTKVYGKEPLKIEKVIKKAEFPGRGGTDFDAVFNHISEKEQKPDGVIIYTDMECSVPDLKGYPKKDVVFLADTESHYNYAKDTFKDFRMAFVKGGDEI